MHTLRLKLNVDDNTEAVLEEFAFRYIVKDIKNILRTTLTTSRSVNNPRPR